jgi:RNA polymerase sigma factor (sigma-70 family)
MVWPAEFSQWSEEVHPVVLSRVWNEVRRTGRVSRATYELVLEGVQDAFVQAAQLQNHPGRFQSPNHFCNWLVIVGKNAAISKMRREQKIVAMPSSIEAPPEKIVEDAVWRKALALLSEEEKQLLHQKYALGWTDARIAQQRKVSLTTVNRQRHDILRRLREHFLQERRDPQEWEIPFSAWGMLDGENATPAAEAGNELLRPLDQERYRERL